MVKKENKLIVWIKALACIMVVVIHTVDIWHRGGGAAMGFVSQCLSQFSVPAVPLFAMVSGLLIFSKDEAPSLALAGKRFWSIFKLIAYFGTIYYIYHTFNGSGNYPFYSVFLSSVASAPLWYLFSILPIYTLSPYLVLPKGKSPGFYWGFLVIACVLYFLTESLKVPPFNAVSGYTLHWLFLYMVIGFILGQLKTVMRGGGGGYIFEPVRSLLHSHGLFRV